jgi:DNA-binding transcriptional ArsR family regulator
MFSKMERWLAEVDGKLKESVAPSSFSSVANCSRCSLLLNSGNHANIGHSDCYSSERVFFDKSGGNLAEHLIDLAQSILTERQKSLLVSAVQELRWNSMTLTRLCEKLSRELKMSYSTVKWNMKRLTEMKLLLGGTEESKGIEARPTTLGCVIASMLTKTETNFQHGEIREPVKA